MGALATAPMSHTGSLTADAQHVTYCLSGAAIRCSPCPLWPRLSVWVTEHDCVTSGGGMLINPKHWPILSRLLDEALEVPPEARERWLESLPEADSAYKEELRTLLRHGSAGETRDFLDILPNLREAVDNARAAVSVMPLRPGT